MLITRRPSRRLSILLWLMIPLLVWWALREIPVQEILTALRGLRPVAILVLVALNLGILFLFSSRWWLILRAQGFRLPYLSLVGYRLAAFGVNYFTPGPQLGGEPLQVYLLQRRQGIPAATAAASVTLDKLLELLANFAFLLVGISTILFSGLIGDSLRIQALLGALGLLALPLGYLLLLRSGRLPLSWVFNLFKKPPRASVFEKVRQFAASAEWQVAQFCKLHPQTILQALILSLLIWIALVFEFSLALHYLGLNLSAVHTLIVLTAARFAILLPIPADLGTLEASQVLAMQSLGINPAWGISLCLLIRARDVLLGGLGLWLGGILMR